MVGEETKRNLYDAATKGEVATFKQLVEEDPYLLDEVSFACSRNLLHIATMYGQLGIIKVLLKMNPQLARDLDSNMSSSLHIAAAQGSLEIAKKLVGTAPEICWWRDCHGMNPVHIAAMNGHVDILEELLRVSLSPALERLDRGQTALHLCVKHGQLGALTVFVEKLGDLVYATDDDGETILHLAVRCLHVEITQYLVKSKKVNKRQRNSMDLTAFGLLAESRRTENYSEIKRILTEGGYVDFECLPYKVMTQKREQTMVVMILIATMAFQAVVSPPGGVWQGDAPSHRVGDSVMASSHPKIYKHFVRANTTAFVSSVVTMFLFTFPTPIKESIQVLIANWLVWVSLGSIAVSYAGSILVITPHAEAQSLDKIINIIIYAPLSLLAGNTLRHLMKCYSWKEQSRETDHPPTTTVDV